MKKVITILALALILVGTVFAATNEELMITVEVKCAEPTFALVGGTATSAPTASSGLTGAVTGIAVETAATTNHTSSKISLSDNAIVDGDIVIYCFIKQTNDKVKSKTTYKYSVAATELTDGTNSTEGVSVSAIAPITASNVDGARATSTANNITSTQYSGKKCNAADLASFSVTWPQTDLPPATYTAYITLTISTN